MADLSAAQANMLTVAILRASARALNLVADHVSDGTGVTEADRAIILNVTNPEAGPSLTSLLVELGAI